MKQTGFIRRTLALLLVLIMTVQLLPMGAMASFGDLKSADPGVELDTLKQEDAINWPIKVYDYLSDGMLFEWMDSNTTTYSSSQKLTVGHTDEAYITPYGGGYKPPVTEKGSDFTYAASSNYSSSNYNSPYYYNSVSTCAYTLTKKDAVDYVSPYYLRITDGTNSNNRNMLLNYFSSDQSTTGSIRYMVLVYRAYKIEDYYFGLSVTGTTGGSPWQRYQVTLKDSTEWTYQVIDLSGAGSYDTIQWIWLTLGTGTTLPASGGMVSGAYLDLTHIGYFDNLTAANNYGAEAVKFDKNPGEYLAHSTGNFTYTHSYVTPVTRGDYLNNIFSLNYCWKNKDTTPKMFDATSNAANVRYGLDFTTHSTDNGWKTNGYTSDTFYTWSNGTTLSLKNTFDNVTKVESVSMNRVNVEQKTQSNGAQYVRITNSGPSKILLSKFREDHQTVAEGYVPLTADVNYMVLVYRPNGLSSNDKFGLWAHGYLDSSSPDDHKTANNWKYAGLTKATDWTTASNVNKLSFSDTSGWQYRIISISNTIAADDSNMLSIDRLANLGMYLPELTDGKSLDIAYVAYFKNNPNASDGLQFEAAETFGKQAVEYMKSTATVTQDITKTDQSFASGRVWYGGGNKSFGMLYSSGGGQYWPSGNSGGESTSTNQYNYGYEFDNWMIGYRTNAQAGDAFNTARYNLVWNATTKQYDKVKFSANYTPTGTSSGVHDNNTFQSGATGTTNYIYFIAATTEDASWGSNDGNTSNGKDFDTTNVPFDGYQLLETITDGVMTAGLLEGGLQTVVVDGISYRVPVYRQETVEYIAYNLLYGLRIPMRDSSGNYNTRYIKGTESTKYGGVDLNGDGTIGWINYDGDSRTGTNGNELNEASVDLATALRHELGLTSRVGNSVNVLATSAGVDSTHSTFIQKMGNYDETLAKSRMLYGEFSDCRNAIDTAMDAAFYLLNNIFISNSYNQEQDDYDYLTLSSAQVNALGHSGFAYVFDAGFTTGKTTTYDTTFTDDGTNKSAVVYSPYADANGVKGTGTISMDGVTGKTKFDYGVNNISWTTRFPFLPITDAEGDFEGQTQSYYWYDDAQRVYTEGSNSYKDRNFNYVIASNGEFVYREADDLFFEFEGDDDVYLFINGQLVLDIGAAHSITSVYIDVNDYVNAAATALKPLEAYGYHKDMSIDQFDEWISASKLVTLDSELNPTTTSITNPYTAAEIEAFKRQHRLNLSDGQICQFDFYYMERHGWGANMRIVTNMHVTDPALKVEKSAYQFDDEVEYGGVIDPSASVEYEFTLNNTGNTKLYNLTWKDDVLGITMDPINGLVTGNNTYVMDSGGGKLEAKDLTAVATGTNVNGEYVEHIITFDEIIGADGVSDGGQTALKKFLAKLESDDGTESGFDDAEVTNAGSGLWVGASVSFRGMFYMLTPEQMEAGMVDNTVYLTATTKTDPEAVGNRTLRSDASHRLYTNGFPIHYQWAGHSIFMNLERLLTEAKLEAEVDGSQLSLYQQFFKNATLDNMYTQPCDQFGKVGGDYSAFLKKHTDDEGHTGYLINYAEPGVYTFYLLLYMKTGLDDEGKSTTFASSGVNASDIGNGYYAILRSQVFVADVEDSVYVLDYGLSTESLDIGGELFKDDYLFGPYGTIRAKLMGYTGTQPSFIDPSKNADATKTGLSFAAENLLETKDNDRVYTPDGFFNVNLSIPSEGKNIAYDSINGEYTLTGVGTVTINAVVPTDNTDWETPYLYYWYNDGVSGPNFPGTPMQNMGAGNFKVDIPADATNIIISNGSHALKTADLTIPAGLESTITVSYDTNRNVTASIETILENVIYHAKPGTVTAEDGTESPAWSDVKIHYQDGEEWFVADATGTDANGYYTFEMPSTITKFYLSDGANNRTTTQTVYAGQEIWLDLGNSSTSNVVDTENGVTTYFYGVTIKYTLEKGYTVHASVPGTWKDNVYIYYWHNGMTDDMMEWPGVKMTKGDLWYTMEDVPLDITHIVINDGKDGGNHQTVDLVITPGLETWIMVKNQTDTQGKYPADVAYGSESGSAGLTFTPQDFMDETNDMWLAITVHSTNASPTVMSSSASSPNYIDIHNETQMYKKVTVLPASVVYYEDCFDAVEYNKDAALTGNVFNRHGNGSGLLSQSIDQSQNYGQDATYQSLSNGLYSGGSLTAVQINDTGDVATFTFKGTGFELIGRTNAVNSASTVAWVYNAATYAPYAQYLADCAEYRTYLEQLAKYNAGELEKKPTEVKEPEEVEKPDALRILPVVTQFDHGDDGGAEAINQVPVIRATGLTHGQYTVVISGVPTYVFENNVKTDEIKETYLYIDGLRIYQPMGATNEHYSDAENGAQILELRDQILKGNIAVGTLNGYTLTVSTALSSWTENLFDNDFDPDNLQTFEGVIVGSADDYLIQGPNNEVYMEGNATGSAMVFYVSKDADSEVHDLQIAVRALDYGKFYGAGSTGLAAQLQFGVLQSDGLYAWKNLARISSGTEQYYTIPVSECPVDASGRYQVVLRAVEPQNNKAAMVAYTNLKVNGYKLEDLGDQGDSTILYFKNGIKVTPIYYLNGTINGVNYTTTTATDQMDDVQFWDGKVSLTLESAAVITIRRDMLDEETGTEKAVTYAGQSDLGNATSVTLYKDDATYGLNVPAGDVTFFLKQTQHGSLKLSYCLHSWNEGTVVKEPTCVHEGMKTLTCQSCGETKDVEIAINPKGHSYSDGKCVLCKEEEPGFYLIGYINGANYGCEGDSANLGEYRFVDGKLVAKFSLGSYVFVKSENNSDYYMANTFDENAKSAVLYHTNTGSYEKLLVPANVEVTFTLVQNADGSLTLSYTYPCDHSWDNGVITTPSTCTDVGAKLFTCTKCSETKIEAIIPAGHNYVNHVCSVCGKYEMMTIYFQNTAQWETVYIWAWDANNGNANHTGGNWPGAVMHIVPGENGLYSYELPVVVTHVIFSNGSGTQTSDLTIPTNGNNLYTYNGEWSLKTDSLDYYLVGYINGADYGCNEDSANLGQYKFVDGKLVVTFEEDSYVFVKTTGNSSWFMTDVYDATKEAVTLFDTVTGAHEKMFAPGGIELTFKLVVNENGTLTLSYTRPCEHSYGEGEQTKDPGCTTDGLIAYTCSKCGDSYTEIVPATGHAYTEDPDVCDYCGQDRTQIIYFKNDDNWETVNIWAWNSSTNFTGGTWPGRTMAYDSELDLYYIELSVKAVNVIFSNGSTQTSDLTIPTDGKLQYNYLAGVWSAVGETVTPEEVKTEYCLIGYINGANSGTDTDWQNTTSYRFTDSIVVTFTEKSYIGVKKADNSAWYWLPSYSEDTTCTFSTSGGSEKQGIPAGTWEITLVENADGSVTLSYAAPVSTASVEVDQALSSAPSVYINNNEGYVLNLISLSQQLNSSTVYGEDEIF